MGVVEVEAALGQGPHGGFHGACRHQGGGCGAQAESQKRTARKKFAVVCVLAVLHEAPPFGESFIPSG